MKVNKTAQDKIPTNLIETGNMWENLLALIPAQEKNIRFWVLTFNLQFTPKPIKGSSPDFANAKDRLVVSHGRMLLGFYPMCPFKLPMMIACAIMLWVFLKLVLFAAVNTQGNKVIGLL